MSSVRTNDEDLRKRTVLLREVAEHLMWELSTIANRKWEDLPELKRKKSVIADRLREFDWTPGPTDYDSLELMMLKSQISDLEYQSKQKLAMQLKLVRRQLDVLREQKQGWLDCVSGYVQKTSNFAGAPA